MSYEANRDQLSCEILNLVVESGIQLKEFRIQRITVKEFGIQFVESRIHSVEYRILDFFRINLLRAILDFYFPGER